MESIELDENAPAGIDDLELTWEFKSATDAEKADAAQSLTDMEEILNFNRRRRRRGGRGRGRRRPGEEEGGSDSDGE